MDPEMLATVTTVYRKAEAALPAAHRSNDDKMALAASILELAECGERDLNRLLDRALACARIIGMLNSLDVREA